MTNGEEWRPIPGYEGIYEVSNRGNVRSIDRHIPYPDGTLRPRRGTILKPHEQGTYRRLTVTLSKSNVHTTVHIHRLVLEAFIGPRPDGMEGCHNDGNPSNNHVENLRWDTHTENLQDAVRHGTHRNTRKTHCPLGHLLEVPNLRNDSSANGYRGCLACSRGRAYIRRKHLPKSMLLEVSNLYYQSISEAEKNRRAK